MKSLKEILREEKKIYFGDNWDYLKGMILNQCH